jgi:hypothetical protein
MIVILFIGAWFCLFGAYLVFGWFGVLLLFGMYVTAICLKL